MVFYSYAQHFEDVFINRCFKDREQGFFIDVGASSPIKDNLTYAFYLRGWRGINIEPIPERIAELQKVRPHDINILAAAGAHAGEVDLIRTPGIGGTSTVMPKIAERMSMDSGRMTRMKTPVRTLGEICNAHDIDNIQFLKIDVEGAALSVLSGADFNLWRPELLIIEALEPLTLRSDYDSWEPLVLNTDYRFVFDDGCNRYYLRSESMELAPAFERPVIPLDNAVQFSALGSALKNQKHPDHEWALTFCSNYLRALAAETEEQLMRVFTLDVPFGLLDKPPDNNRISFAYWRVLARSPSSTEKQRLLSGEGPGADSLQSLFRSLLTSDEFRMRRGRCAS